MTNDLSERCPADSPTSIMFVWTVISTALYPVQIKHLMVESQNQESDIINLLLEKASHGRITYCTAGHYCGNASICHISDELILCHTAWHSVDHLPAAAVPRGTIDG